MEILLPVLSILALVFSVLGFLAGCWSVVQVLAMKNSTHRITQLPVDYEGVPESRVELDLPQQVLDQLPSPPDAKTLNDYLTWQARQEAEAAFEDE